MKTAFIFPGQGAQYVGMAKDFYDRIPECKAIIDEADEVLDFDLKPGEAGEAAFRLTDESFLLFDAHGTRRVFPGEYTVYIGGGQPENLRIKQRKVAALRGRGGKAFAARGKAVGKRLAVAYVMHVPHHSVSLLSR